MEILLAVVLLAFTVWLVSGPLRARARGDGEEPASERDSELADLEAAKQSKYREIRDAELDYRTGKLDEADFHAIDDGLRAEAIELLRRIDRARGAG